ncbi:MAG TPA: EAL domain-containing protein [Nocardioidaceae bacterium]|nr:EAL domain-containing protein [Nocardioidaceae bacterium]
MDTLPEPTCIVDSQGDIVAVNRAWMICSAPNGPHPDCAGVGSSYLDVYRAASGPGPGEAAQVAEGLQQLLAGEVDAFEVTYPAPSRGEERWFRLRGSPLPLSGGAVLTHIDITAASDAERSLSYQALHDGLTGLPNRALLDDRLRHALTSANRTTRQVAVACVNLDSFRRVNDIQGYKTGDELLRAVAGRLGDHLRGGDTLARLAGDEFVILWPGIGHLEEAEHLVRRVTAAFAAPFVVPGPAGPVPITASVGVAVSTGTQSSNDLMMAASAAMQYAKKQGHGRTKTYTEALRESVQAQQQTEAELWIALERGEFVLHYQPVVDLETKAVVGVEALVRWQHPDGLRLPDTFIPAAEASGLIEPLSAWVLETACSQVAAWSADGLDLDLAVNISAKLISHPDLPTTIADALRQSGLDPTKLLIEVTESMMMEDAEVTGVALGRIADLGPRVAIDDFGTGYSSLVYLKRYPIHVLKIDRSFVAGMGSSPSDDAIVASVVALADAVGGVCIAEGVETPEQLAALRALGCQFAQGFLLGPPLAAAVLFSALTSGRSVVATPEPASLIDEAGSTPRLSFLRGHDRTGTAPPGVAPETTQGVRHYEVQAAHDVDFFTTDSDLVSSIAAWVNEGITAGEHCVVVATRPHRTALRRRLGPMLPAAKRAGRYIELDAEVTLDRLLSKNLVDPTLFGHVIGGLLTTACGQARPVRVYGEMVGLLWARGDVASVAALENLWNGLRERLDFSLLCGYLLETPTVLSADVAGISAHHHRTKLDVRQPDTRRAV